MSTVHPLLKFTRAMAFALPMLAAAVASQASDTFNAVTDQLSIPELLYGTVTYSNMVITPGTVDKVAGGTPGGTEDTYGYSPSYGFVLTAPSVIVGSTTYTNVTATIAGLVSVGGVSGADSYDGTYLYIPSVSVGGKIYPFGVITVAKVDSVAGGFPRFDMDAYSPSTNQLLVPAVEYGGHVYTNVTVTVGNIVSVNGSGTVSGGAKSSTCYDPAYYATGTTMDLFYEDPTRGPASAYEVQSVVVPPSTFNGIANAVGIQNTTIASGRSSVTTEYYDITSTFPILQQLGFYTPSVGITETYTPGVPFGGAVTYGQSVQGAGVAAQNGGTPTSYSTADVFEGLEDITVPAGTFAAACKWSLGGNYGTGLNKTTVWMTHKGVLLQIGTVQLQAGSTFNGGPVGP